LLACGVLVLEPAALAAAETARSRASLDPNAASGPIVQMFLATTDGDGTILSVAVHDEQGRRTWIPESSVEGPPSLATLLSDARWVDTLRREELTGQQLALVHVWETGGWEFHELPPFPPMPPMSRDMWGLGRCARPAP